MISLLVEGKGDRKAGPQLVRRLLHSPDIFEFGIEVGSEATATQGKGDLRRWFEGHLRLLCGNNHCQGIVVLVNSDNDPPCKLARDLAIRAQSVSSVPVVVVCPVEEFENWFVCSIESICQDRTVEIDCEHVDNPKKLLDECLPGGYRSTLDQSDLVWKIDLDRAFQRSPSLVRLRIALKELVTAIQSGQTIFTPACP